MDFVGFYRVLPSFTRQPTISCAIGSCGTFYLHCGIFFCPLCGCNFLVLLTRRSGSWRSDWRPRRRRGGSWRARPPPPRRASRSRRRRPPKRPKRPKRPNWPPRRARPKRPRRPERPKKPGKPGMPGMPGMPGCPTAWSASLTTLW